MQVVAGDRYEERVGYDLRINVAGGELITRGSVSADIAFVCVRCAEFFSTTVKEPAFLRVVELPDKTECVDLTDDIRESIILAFPLNPLCSADCKGLCRQCGTNLNKRTCDCVPPVLDDRWNALNELRLT